MEQKFRKFISTLDEGAFSGVAASTENIVWSFAYNDFYFWSSTMRELQGGGDLIIFDSEGMADVPTPLAQIKKNLLEEAPFLVERLSFHQEELRHC